MVSPIMDIFPFTEELDKEISRKPITVEESVEEEVSGKGVVFTASGSDADDEEDDSEVVDDYDGE